MSDIEEGGDEQIARFEEMLNKKTTAFFDLDVYEDIIYHYIEKNQLSKAFKACELANETYPYSAVPLFLKAQVLVRSGSPKEALNYIEKVESIQPNDVETIVTKANIYASLGKHKQAISTIERVLNLGVERESIYGFIAQNYLKINNYEKSYEYFTLAITLNPEDDLIFDDFMDFVEIAAYYKQAMDFFEKQIDEDPYATTAWFRLGIVANAKGDYAKALHALDYATLIKEDFADAWAEMGCVYMNQQQYKEAKQIFEKVLTVETPSAEIYTHLAASMEKMKDYEGAIKTYKKAIETKETYHIAWYGVGICLILQGNHYQAIHYLKRAVKYHKYSGDYWRSLAEAEYFVGNVVSSIEAYREASY